MCHEREAFRGDPFEPYGMSPTLLHAKAKHKAAVSARMSGLAGNAPDQDPNRSLPNLRATYANRVVRNLFLSLFSDIRDGMCGTIGTGKGM